MYCYVVGILVNDLYNTVNNRRDSISSGNHINKYRISGNFAMINGIVCYKKRFESQKN